MTASTSIFSSSGGALVSERARRRIARRLIPFLFLLYVLNYLDRVNISYAALQMTADLHFSNSVFGLGAGIFFIGYFVLQIPAAMLVDLWSARLFIATTLIVWGMLATLTGLITSVREFYWIRFLLGVAEAGFFPGVVVYMTHWFKDEDRAKTLAMFMMAIPISNLLGAAVASALMQIHWFGYAGWRWLLIGEGMPSVLAGIATFFYLSDWPKQAAWLAEDERTWISDELAREHAAKPPLAKHGGWKVLRHPQVIILSLAYFCYITDSIGLSTWLPKIVQRLSHESTSNVILISGIPWLLAIPAMLLTAWHSDTTDERQWHAAVPIFIVGAALVVGVGAGSHLFVAMAAFSLATMALYSFPSPFWAVATLFLGGPAAAATIALINATGNLGGFLGPYAIGYLTDRTGSYSAGLYYLCASSVLGAVAVLAVSRSKVRKPLGGPS